MATFNVGDKVRRKPKDRFQEMDSRAWTVIGLEDQGFLILGEWPGPNKGGWDPSKFDLVESAGNPAPAIPVTNSVPMGYPDNNPKTAMGLAKPSFAPIPPVAVLHLGRAMADGRKKYGLMNWREKTISSSVYYDAAMRHLMAWWDGEDNASDSGVHHLGHAMACMALVLDSMEQGKLNDDRPIKGTFAQTAAAFTNKAA